MKKQNVYETLQQYKSAGTSCLKAPEILKIDYKTAHKYWKMSPEEYQRQLYDYQNCGKKADQYRDEVLALLRRAPFLSASQIAKCICNNNGIEHLEVSDKAFWNYVTELRKEYNIPKNALEIIHNDTTPSSDKPSINERIHEKRAKISSSTTSKATKMNRQNECAQNIGL